MEWKPFSGDAAAGEFDFFAGEENEETSSARESDRDAILFMVDCQASMFVPNASGEVPFEMAVHCCISFYKDKVLSNNRDFVGLMLYATEHKLNAFDFPNIYLFHALERPSAQRIKELESLISDRPAFLANVGHCAKPFPLHDGLWTAQHLFNHLPKALGFRRILLFTNDDNPPKGSEATREKCLARAKDLLEADISLQLFAVKKGLAHQLASTSPPTSGAAAFYSAAGSHSGSTPDTSSGKKPSSGTPPKVSASLGMGSRAGPSGSLLYSMVAHGASLNDSLGVRRSSVHPVGSSGSTSGAGGTPGESEESFDSSIFWRHLIYVSDDEWSASQAEKAIYLDAKNTFAEMLEPLKRKAHQKRSVGRLQVVLGADSLSSAVMGVQLYYPCMRARPGSAVNLEAKSNAKLVTETRLICHDTAEVLSENDIRSVLNVGSEKVEFETHEMGEMKKQFGEPVMRILGFKPISAFKPRYHLGHAMWIHPDESAVSGSTKVFAGLLKQLHKMQRAAVAEVIARKGVVPRLYALIPQTETYEVDGSKDENAGFHLIPLPYADDIRDLRLDPPPDKGEGHADQVTKAKKIIKRMQVQPALAGGESRYDPADYPNPALQKHYTVLQSIALEEDYEDIPDYTLPDYPSMRTFRDYFTDFAKSVYPEEGYLPEVAVQGKAAKAPAVKRAADTGYDSPTKAPKVDISHLDFPSMVHAGTLNSVGVPHLKQFLRENKQAVSGNKATLISRITEYLTARKSS